MASSHQQPKPKDLDQGDALELNKAAIERFEEFFWDPSTRRLKKVPTLLPLQILLFLLFPYMLQKLCTKIIGS